MIRKAIETVLVVVAAICLMGTAYTPITNETGMQLRNDLNARLSGVAPISPTYTTVTATVGTFSIGIFTGVTNINCDASGGNVTIQLYHAGGYGKFLTAKKIDSSGNTCILEDITGSTIDGASSYTLSTQYQWVQLIDGALNMWSVLSATGGGGGGVSSVGLTTPSYLSVTGSPVTGSGTLTISGTSQSANQVLASPNGTSGVMGPRPLAGADLPNPSSSTLGGVQSKASVTHQFLNSISTSGVPAQSQPAFSDVSGTVAPAQLTVPPTDFTPIDPGRIYSSEWKSISVDQSTIWSAANAIQAAIVPSGGSAPSPDAVSFDSDNSGSNAHSCGGSSAGSLALCGLSATVGEGLYAWICASNGTLTLSWGLPSGWSNVVYTTNGTTVDMCGLFYKTAVSGDTSAPTYAFTESPNGAMSGIMFEVKNGAAPSSPPTSNSVASGNPSAPSITTASTNNLVVACYGAETNRSGFAVPAGYNLIVDPNVPVNFATNHQGGTNSKYAAVNGRTTGNNPLLCAAKVQAAAGATGAAASSSAQILLAYGNGPGEVDGFNIIRLGSGGSASIVQNKLTVWRDGESTPSVNLQLQDLASRRAVLSGTRFHTRYIDFGAGVFAGGGESEQLYLTMPFTQSVVVQLTNPDTSNQATLWSNLSYHANSIGTAGWNGQAHFEAITNASYPSADSVSAYNEDTLCNIAGAGALWNVVMQVTGGDINSQSFEEGRLRIYVDGESTASWDTSGTEDSFQSSFNWSNETVPFGADFYGTTYYVAPTGSVAGAFGAYRIFGSREPVSFKTNLKVTWTAGNSVQGGVTNPVSLYSNVGVYLNQ